MVWCYIRVIGNSFSFILFDKGFSCIIISACLVNNLYFAARFILDKNSTKIDQSQQCDEIQQMELTHRID